MARTIASHAAASAIPRSKPAAHRSPVAWFKARLAERLLVLSLNRLSDRELADMGMSRHDIAEAIRTGRPNMSSMS